MCDLKSHDEKRYEIKGGGRKIVFYRIFNNDNSGEFAF